MKSVKLPDEMVNSIRDYIIKNKAYGYETIAEFVRGAVRHKLIEMLPPKTHPKRLYRCDGCGKEEITTSLISGVPHCSLENTFTFVKIIDA